MKKLIGFFAIALLGLSSTFAQTTPAPKKTAPAAVTKTTPKKETKKAAPVAGPTKKDGTADMRYSVNKNAKVAGPKKKDGTADMRYKSNKTAAKPAAKKN